MAIRYVGTVTYSRGRSHPPTTFSGSSAIAAFAGRDVLSITRCTLNVNFSHLKIPMFLCLKLSVLMDLSPCRLLRMTFLMVVTKQNISGQDPSERFCLPLYIIDRKKLFFLEKLVTEHTMGLVKEHKSQVFCYSDCNLSSPRGTAETTLAFKL